MRLGIIGLPNSGKTTIFNALTGNSLSTNAASSGQFTVITEIVDVPDPRVDALSTLYHPEKTTYARITYCDIGGLDKGIGEGGLKGQFRLELSQVDGFLHIVRAFESDTVPHPYVTVDPQRDVEALDAEFILADLLIVEARLERLQGEIRSKGKNVDKAVPIELAIMERFKAHLENEKPLRDLDLSDYEEKLARGFGFLTRKPVMVVLNIGDEMLDPEEILQYRHERSLIVGLQGALEAELSELDPEDAATFMEEYGVTELSASKVVKLSYDLMRIQSFFTIGTDEVRAWSIPVGATSLDAAGSIHTDLQKGFIRAEVMHVNDLLELGSEAAIKSAGKMHLEGRDYVVQDNDILCIRSSN